MLIFDILTVTGSLFLLICVLLNVVAINQGRGRRKLQTYKQMLFARVMEF
jgi:hypothetical protein